MRILVTVEPYNTRRYGRPWIAKITDWPVGRHPTLEFGVSLDARTAEIDANPGDVIRWGQKDHRGGSENEWAIVAEDGTLRAHATRACREHWLRGCQPVPPAQPQETNVVQLKP